MIWHLENPLRLRRERDLLEALASSADWLIPREWRIDSSLRLIWDADILAGSRSFPVSLRYPNHFPHSPPLVLPRGASERWSSHQYGAGGELCLEFGTDNWHPDLTGADMVQSAYRLLQGEQPAPGQPAGMASRHATTLGQDMRGDRLRLLVTCSLAETIRSLPDGVLLQGTIVGIYHDRSFVYTIPSVAMPTGEKWVDSSIPKVIVDESFERPFALFRWPADADLPPMNSLTEFQAAIAGRGIDLPDVGYTVVTRRAEIYAYALWKDDGTVGRISVLPAQSETGRLDESHTHLKERKVAIVGCGSLGSKLAVMMARSGVGKFLLVDDDIMLPGNFARHELDWREVGTHKVAAVARRIQLVNPVAQCRTREYRLGGQQSSDSIETLIETLSQCDLLVDATAEARVFNYLSAAVAVGKKPLVWAEVFGGGFGGLIARHRPGLEPDPASMRRTIEAWCAERGKPMERAAQDYQSPGPGPPLIADDADVAVIAAHAARLVIDTLIPRSPSMFPNSVYLIGLAQGWVFDQPFDTRPIDVGPAQPHLTAEPVNQDIADEERAYVMGLLKKFADAAASDQPDSETPAP